MSHADTLARQRSGSVPGRLRITLFGPAQVVSADGTRTYPLQRKTLNVLAFLILHRQRPVDRDTIAFTLFPDEDEEKARASLRRNLSYLLSALPECEPGGEPFVISGAERIGWNSAAPASVDVAEFERLLAGGQDDEALAQYVGPLLPAIYDDWSTAERERLRDLAHSAIARTIARDRSLRRFDAATAAAHRLLDDDPWREDVVRELMAVRYEAGDRAGALAVFTQFADRLRIEMDADVMPETLALRDAMLRGSRLATSEPMVRAASRPAPSLPFVGREGVMAEATARWHACADGRAGALFVSGEAGIGKSRLAIELARAIEREGGATLIGETSAGGERCPYEAIVEALRYASPLGGTQAARRADAWRSLVDHMLEDHAFATLADDRSARVRLFDAVRRAVGELARTRPIAIVLEDLHWAGSATIELLRFLLDRLGTTTVLIVATFRDDELPRAHPLRVLLNETRRMGNVTRVALARLDEADARAAARGAAVGSLDAARLEQAVGFAEGVPLVLSEAMRELAAGRMPESGDFRSFMHERYARLAPDAAMALTFAAVIGSRFDLAPLATAIGWQDDRLIDALTPSIELGLIRAASREAGLAFAFTHHVVHAVILDRVATADRVHCHGLVARAMLATDGGNERALEVAGHFAAAGDRRRAAESYALGARHALEVFANAEARDAATLGLEHTAADAANRELRYRLLDVREQAFARIGAPSERLRDALDLVELAGDDREVRCDALARLVRAGYDAPDVQRSALERLGRLAGESARSLATYEEASALFSFESSDFRAAAAAAGRAAGHHDERGDVAGALRARLLQLRALTFLGDHAAASTAIVDLRGFAEACDDLALRAEFFCIASTTARDGERERSLLDAERALEFALLIGDRRLEGFAHEALAFAWGYLHEGGREMEALERARAAFADIGDVNRLRQASFNLAGQRGWAGDFAGALRLLDDLGAPGDDDAWFALQLLAHRGATYLRAGRFSPAEDALRQALDAATALGIELFVARIHACLGEIAARTGRRAEAIAELSEAIALLEPLNVPTSTAEAHALLARVDAEANDTAAARKRIRAALAATDRLDEAESSPRFAWDLAATSALIGDGDAAIAFAQRALRAFGAESLGMSADVIDAYARLPWHRYAFALLAGRDVPLRLADERWVPLDATGADPG